MLAACQLLCWLAPVVSLFSTGFRMTAIVAHRDDRRNVSFRYGLLVSGRAFAEPGDCLTRVLTSRARFDEQSCQVGHTPVDGRPPPMAGRPDATRNDGEEMQRIRRVKLTRGAALHRLAPLMHASPSRGTPLRRLEELCRFAIFHRSRRAAASPCNAAGRSCSTACPASYDPRGFHRPLTLQQLFSAAPRICGRRVEE